MRGLRSIPKIIKEKGFVIIFIEKIIPNSQISLHLFLGEYNVTFGDWMSINGKIDVCAHKGSAWMNN